MSKCTHKTERDHVVVVSADGKKVWRCTSCKTTGRWAKGWLYFGNIECRKWFGHLLYPSIERVLCPSCAAPHQANAVDL